MHDMACLGLKKSPHQLLDMKNTKKGKSGRRLHLARCYNGTVHIIVDVLCLVHTKQKSTTIQGAQNEHFLKGLMLYAR